MEILKKSGYTSWVWFLMDKGYGNAVSKWWGIPGYPSPQYKAKYVEMLKKILSKLKEGGYPVPKFIVVNDEPTLEKYDVKRILEEEKWIADEIPEVRNYTVVFRKDDPKVFEGKPYLHMWVANNASPEVYEAAKRNGCTLSTYRVGMTWRGIADVRFHLGYKSLWFDAPSTFIWGNNWDYGGTGSSLSQQLDTFKGEKGSWNTLTFKTPGGLSLEPLAKPPRVSEQATVCGGGNKNNHYIQKRSGGFASGSLTYQMLAMREAIDDRKYAETLRKDKGDGSLKDLKENILDKFTPKGEYSYKELPEWVDPWTYGQNIQYQYDGQPEFLNKWREMVTEKILK